MCNLPDEPACGNFGGRSHQAGVGCPYPFIDDHFDTFMGGIRQMVLDLLEGERKAERDRVRRDEEWKEEQARWRQ